MGIVRVGFIAGVFISLFLVQTLSASITGNGCLIGKCQTQTDFLQLSYPHANITEVQTEINTTRILNPNNFNYSSTNEWIGIYIKNLTSGKTAFLQVGYSIECYDHGDANYGLYNCYPVLFYEGIDPVSSFVNKTSLPLTTYSPTKTCSCRNGYWNISRQVCSVPETCKLTNNYYNIAPGSTHQYVLAYSNRVWNIYFDNNLLFSVAGYGPANEAMFDTENGCSLPCSAAKIDIGITTFSNAAVKVGQETYPLLSLNLTSNSDYNQDNGARIACGDSIFQFGYGLPQINPSNKPYFCANAGISSRTTSQTTTKTTDSGTMTTSTTSTTTTSTTTIPQTLIKLSSKKFCILGWCFP